jgi:hypothetical protein
VYVYEFPVTSTGLFKISAFIRDKVTAYLENCEKADDEIPPCSPEERWERPSKFAVMKEGRQRAVKLYENESEARARAQELGAGYFIEHRPGESVRCQNYCVCSGFCNFCRENVAAETEKTAA